MKLWDNDLRNKYKKPELHAYYWCFDRCFDYCFTPPKIFEDTVNNVKNATETVVNNVKNATETAVNGAKNATETASNGVNTAVNGVKNGVNTAGATAGYLAGKATSGIAEKVEDWGNSFGRAMQDVGDFTRTSGIFDALSRATGLKELAQNVHESWKYGAGLLPEQQVGPSPMPDGDEDKGAQTKTETDEAATTAAGAGAASEREAANTAKESGVNAARSGNMAGANNSAQALTNGLYQAGAAQNAATQADYRDKIAQADIMDTQAGNMAKGAKLMPWYAGLQGLGQGFNLGMLLSDENSKEAPVDGIDDDKLKEAIEQFKSLYAQLQEIKKCQQ